MARHRQHRDEAETFDLDTVGRIRWDFGDHRSALAHFVLLGWTPHHIGEWAIVLRSPTAAHAARISPFDPGYPAFLELSHSCPGNLYLPRLELTAGLCGGGSLTVSELLTPADTETSNDLMRRWTGTDRDAELDDVHHHATTIGAKYATRLPWWKRVEVTPDRVRLGRDGRPVLVGLFRLDRVRFRERLLEDPESVRAQLPSNGSRHVPSLPFLTRDLVPEQLSALGRAWDPD